MDVHRASSHPPIFSNGTSTNDDQGLNFTDPRAKVSQFSDCPLKPHIKGQKSNCKSKKRVPIDHAIQPSCSSSSSSLTIYTQHSSQRCLRLAPKRRNPRFLVRRRASDVEAIAFPLGMSIAAVVAQICTSAVRESLANVFGDKFDAFAINFEKSFASTLSTLRLIKDSAIRKGEDELSHFSFKNHSPGETSTMSCNRGECSSKTGDLDSFHTEFTVPSVNTQEQLSNIEELEESQPTDATTQELLLPRQMSLQLTHSSSSMQSYTSLPSMLGTLEKSVLEQARANDLKTFEIGLSMEKLRLKKTELALNSDSNFLERCKISMGISKASFKAEKFKNQLEDTRYNELLKKCIDCLVASLLIMSASLSYGAYVYSYKRITEATLSCSSSMESKSWWTPKPMASFTSGLQTIRCLVQVFSRMLFGILMILSIAYLLVQRSATSRQTMPVTFILLLLGIGCGFAGKFCVDTLGGSGYHWLIFWEMLCAVHFFANVFTSVLVYILHGPIKVSQGTKGSTIFPYWIRRIFFYLTMLLALPLFCGLMPFASPGEWKDHFSSLITNMLLVAADEN
ncbi:hypothetical protein Ancab_026729 [Ancistrocladus abbreviatus]